MKSLLIAIFIVSCYYSHAEGCSGAALRVGNYFARVPYAPAIGTLYLPKYSNYTITAYGNIACSYYLRSVKVYLNNILIAKDDTSNSYEIKFVLGAYPGTYRVETDLWPKLWITDWDFEIADNPLGLKELSEQQHLLVFPNPAKDFVALQSEKEITAVSLFNTSGVLLNTLSLSAQTVELPIGNYAPGIYFLHVAILEEQPVIKKIVIQ